MPTEDYPFLAHWKAQALDRFPDIPFEELVWVVFERERAAFRRRCQRSPYARFFSEEALQILRQRLEEELYHEVACRMGAAADEKILSFLLAKGLEQNEAEKAARLKGEDFQIQPPGGGGVKFSQTELIVLKCLYRELQTCIKEVRQANELSLKQDAENPDRSSDLARYEGLDLTIPCPWLPELFEEKEIPILIKYTPSRSAVTILARRLKNRFGLRYSISIRTLIDLLNSIKLP